MKKYLNTVFLTTRGQLNSGIIYLMPDIIIRMITLITLTFLWRVVMSKGAEVGMSLAQMLTYVYMSALLTDMLIVRTPAGNLAGGLFVSLCTRPMSIFGQIAAETVGGWVPKILLFSLPMAFLAPVIGVNIIPRSPVFLISLLLCISLGFAVDFLFACLTIKLRNMSGMIGRIRTAMIAILSGTIIPIKLLPLGLDKIMQYQPFASLGGAVLSIMVDSVNAVEILTIQIVWNLLLWPLALIAFHKTKEEMVSYGG